MADVFERVPPRRVRILGVVCLTLGATLLGCRPPSAPGDDSTQAPIAFLAQADGVWQVWWMKTPQSRPERVAHTNQDIVRLSWFPNGRELLLNMQDGKLLKADTTNGDLAEIEFPDHDVQDAVIGPDGRRIAYSISIADSTDRNDIWLFDTATRERRKLTTMPGLQHEPAWSRDGRWIYFLSGAGPQSHDIWRIEIETGKKEQLTTNALYHFDPAAREDGSVVYSSNREGDYDLWLSRSGRSLQRLTHDAALDARPAWSPDGKTLIFESTREGGAAQIWHYDLGSKQFRRLTNIAGGARMPVWATGEAGR